MSRFGAPLPLVHESMGYSWILRAGAFHPARFRFPVRVNVRKCTYVRRSPLPHYAKRFDPVSRFGGVAFYPSFQLGTYALFGRRYMTLSRGLR